MRSTSSIVHFAMDVLPQGDPAEAGAPAPLRLILRLPVIGYLRIKLLYNSPNEETPPVPGRDPRPGLHRGPSLVPRLAAGLAERPGRTGSHGRGGGRPGGPAVFPGRHARERDTGPPVRGKADRHQL